MSALFHPVAAWVVRVALGGILIYASWHKIADPPDFAKIIFNYKLLPEALINPAAIYLPWVEAIAGAALIVGIGRRGAGLLAGLLFAAFIAALSYNLARECPTICGCFSTFAENQQMTDAEKFSEMRQEIAVDAGCLLLAVHVLVASSMSRGRSGGTGGTTGGSAAG